jgi:AraC-like DNA-binding protein
MLENTSGPEEVLVGSDGVTAAAIDCTWKETVNRRFEGVSDLRCRVQLTGNSIYSYDGEDASGTADPQVMFVYKPHGCFKDEHIEAGVHERSITLVFPVSDEGFGGCGRDDPSIDRALHLMGDNVLARQRAMSRTLGDLTASILDADRSARNFEKLRRSRLDELACLTMDLFLDGFGDAARYTITARERRQVLDARDVLIADMAAPPPLARLAATVGTNRTKLNRGFQAIFGMSPYQLLYRERMARARALLQDGALSVTEIALQCGYDHLSNFSLAVKAFHGQAPSALRARTVV